MNPFSLKDQTSQALSSHWEFIFFKKIESTNNHAKENLTKLHPPSLIMAEHQTAGRGRGTNTWEDENKGQQFLSTWVLKLGAKNPDPRWTILLGYSVYESLQAAWPKLHFSIKAPNDIYINDKKLGGLLTETTSLGQHTFLILGLGINVFSKPQVHKSSACFLSENLKKLAPKDWEVFIQKLVSHLDGFENQVSKKDWLEKITPGLITALNKNPHHKGNPVREIRPDGSLLLDQGYLSWLEL